MPTKLINKNEKTNFLAINKRTGSFEKNRFVRELANIDTKAMEFAAKGQQDFAYQNKALIARILHTQLRQAYEVFKQENTQYAHHIFQQTCHRIINQAKPELEPCQGWGLIFANIGLAIALLNISHLTLELYNALQTQRLVVIKPQFERLPKAIAARKAANEADIHP